jgi:uncharacterized FlaG/YvyC family protein
VNIGNVSLGLNPSTTNAQSAQVNQAQGTNPPTNKNEDVVPHELRGNHDLKQLVKAADDLNKKLEGSSMKVVLDPNTPANKLWFNVVDNVSGKVIEKLPPEGLRRFIETNDASGLKLDMKY